MSRFHLDGHELTDLSAGWEAAAGLPDDADRGDVRIERLDWLPARVPGTVAGALRDAGLWRPDDRRDLDSEEWWFRTRFGATPAGEGEEVVLRLEGVATVADIYLNAVPILQSRSMFTSHEVNVTSLLRDDNELVIRCHPLKTPGRSPRSPRERWRTKIANDRELRFHRTMLIGRAPGFSPRPAAVGPWRPVSLERRRGIVVEQLAVRPRLEGDRGVVVVEACLRTLGGSAPGGAQIKLSGPSGEYEASLTVARRETDVVLSGEVAVPRAALWWPHTHGRPELHEVAIVVDHEAGFTSTDAGRVGFRRLMAGSAPGHNIEAHGIDLHVNGVQVFCRGAVWTPVDPIGLAPAPDELRRTLERLRAAGMNMLRIPGISCYESDLFHDLCDELGILVWQDFMFANFDYPIEDPGFRELVTEEARGLLERLRGRASLAVLCGNSEVEQQAAMVGLEPALGRGELFGELLPGLVGESGTDAVYVPSAPFGGDLPFRPDAGIANYYGVGGYFRPLEDVRRSEVRFAAECLGIANVPDDDALVELFPSTAPAVHHPTWKAAVPRDAGSSWDFDDVRDFYLAEVFRLDPTELRRTDPVRYLELSRLVSGEVMAEVLGEWRRAESPCGGALILWARDLVPGAGWGVLDSRGAPKVAYHYLRRVQSPIAVWLTDEGLGGMNVHVANDRQEPFRGSLRIALYQDSEFLVEEESRAIELDPHSTLMHGVEELLGRFVDVGWAYRFGPPGHDVVVATLEYETTPRGAPVSQAFRFPVGYPLRPELPERLGLVAHCEIGTDGVHSVRIRSRCLAFGVRIGVTGFEPHDDVFCVEPGAERAVRLAPVSREAEYRSGAVTAVNLRGRVPISPPTQRSERGGAGASG